MCIHYTFVSQRIQFWKSNCKQKVLLVLFEKEKKCCQQIKTTGSQHIETHTMNDNDNNLIEQSYFIPYFILCCSSIFKWHAAGIRWSIVSVCWITSCRRRSMASRLHGTRTQFVHQVLGTHTQCEKEVMDTKAHRETAWTHRNEKKSLMGLRDVNAQGSTTNNGFQWALPLHTATPSVFFSSLNDSNYFISFFPFLLLPRLPWHLLPFSHPRLYSLGMSFESQSVRTCFFACFSVARFTSSGTHDAQAHSNHFYFGRRHVFCSGWRCYCYFTLSQTSSTRTRMPREPKWQWQAVKTVRGRERREWYRVWKKSYFEWVIFLILYFIFRIIVS